MIDLVNKPNPGSDEAVEMGCKCPILDNEYGEGCGGEFVIRLDCPVHTMSVQALQAQIGINNERD